MCSDVPLIDSRSPRPCAFFDGKAFLVRPLALNTARWREEAHTQRMTEDRDTDRFDEKDPNGDSAGAAGSAKGRVHHNEATGHYDDSEHEAEQRKPGQHHNEATGHYDDKDQ
jgi:hypothetical protein